MLIRRKRAPSEVGEQGACLQRRSKLHRGPLKPLR
jgi:hypothetical protein